MSFLIKTSADFNRKLRRLLKEYRSLGPEILRLREELAANPTLGTPIGHDCYKIRLAIQSKGKGKSGGARVITYVRVTESTIVLLTIYDKSEQADISDAELTTLLKSVEE